MKITYNGTCTFIVPDEDMLPLVEAQSALESNRSITQTFQDEKVISVYPIVKVTSISYTAECSE